MWPITKDAYIVPLDAMQARYVSTLIDLLDAKVRNGEGYDVELMDRIERLLSGKAESC